MPVMMTMIVETGTRIIHGLAWILSRIWFNRKSWMQSINAEHNGSSIMLAISKESYSLRQVVAPADLELVRT